MNTTAEQPNPSQGQPIVSFDAWCNSCGYNLLGLPLSGNCPECAKPVEQSLRGDLLSNCEPAHIATLLKGVTFILNGILAQVALGVISVVIMIILQQTGASTTPFQILSNFVGIAVSGIILFGWWQFSTLDPAYSGRNDASQARTWIRNLLIAAIVITIMSLFLGFLPPELLVITIIVGVINMVVSVARYFFEMSYLRWLAPRIPNEKVAQRAKRLLWLGPVLCTVGLLLLGLGPIIALVMYWNLLHWVRLDLKKIQASQATGTSM
jgi:hypothetical protein